jgi:hypothetical protein
MVYALRTKSEIPKLWLQNYNNTTVNSLKENFLEEADDFVGTD